MTDDSPESDEAEPDEPEDVQYGGRDDETGALEQTERREEDVEVEDEEAESSNEE